MAKNKININPAMPSDEQVAKHQDFGKLLEQFAANPGPGEGGNGSIGSQAGKTGFNMGRLFGIIATVAVVVTGVVLYLKFVKNEITPAKEEPATEAIVEHEVQPPLVQQPFQGLNVAYQTYKVQPGQEQVLEYSTGTKIYIPSNAFLDSAGKLVTGEVVLRYREMHDPVDILASGVPMHYDTAAGDYYLESAGMCEILAFQNNRPLQANPDAVIQIEMASFQKGDQYNLYYLDEKNERKWVQKGKAGYQEVEQKQEKSKKEHQYTAEQMKEEKGIAATGYDKDGNYVEVQAIVDKKGNFKFDSAVLITDSTGNEYLIYTPPMKPIQENPSKRSFVIDIDPNDYPEMAPFKNLKWQYAGTVDSLDPAKNPWVFREIWSDVWVERKGASNKYTLHFTKADKAFTTIVTPVFAGEDMEQAMKTYNEQFRDYQQKMKKQQNNIYRNRQQMQQAMTTDTSVSSNVFYANQPAISYRSFPATQFGTWNCDSPIPQPKGATVNATFKSSDKSTVAYSGYLIDVNKNTVFQVMQGQDFTFNPKSSSFLVTTNGDGYLALFTPADFQDLKENMKGLGKKNQTLVFTIKNEKPDNISDLRQHLMESL